MDAIKVNTRPNLQEAALNRSAATELSTLTGLGKSIYLEAERTAVPGTVTYFPGGLRFNSEPGVEVAEPRINQNAVPRTMVMSNKVVIENSLPSEEPDRAGHDAVPRSVSLGRLRIAQTAPAVDRDPDIGSNVSYALVIKGGKVSVDRNAAVAMAA